MATFSVSSVHQLCQGLGMKPATPGALQSRRQAMTDLYTALCPDSPALADQRPLGDKYKLLLPACRVETALQWDSNDSQHSMRKAFSRAHPLDFGRRVLEESFPEGAPARADMAQLLPFIERNFMFGLQVLTRFSEMESLDTDPRTLMTGLINPLARRCENRCINRETSSRLWSVITRCLRRHQALRNHVGLDPPSYENSWPYQRLPFHGLILFAVRRWARKRHARTPRDDAALAELIGFMPEATAKSLPLQGILRPVPPAARYELLRLFYLHAQGYCCDIGPTDRTDGIPPGIKLGLEALLLPPHEALGLLERMLISDQPCVVSLTSVFRREWPSYGPRLPWRWISERWQPPREPWSILDVMQGPHEQIADPLILRALLLRHAIPSKLILPVSPVAVMEQLSSEELDHRKKQAEQGRSPEDRAFWAQSALCLCIAIGDIVLYAETLLWTRRYIKDPLVVKEMFDGQCLLTDEGTDLICLLPARFRKFTNYPKSSREEIEQANKVLLHFFEGATLALREPSSHLPEWFRVYKLAGVVVRKRLERVNAFQDHHNLSDAEVFEIVWKPTIDVLIEAETMMLHPDPNKFLRREKNGLITGDSLGRVRPPTMKCLDALAEARDKLWAKHRGQENPFVMSLKPPWPRGLPVQCLMQFQPSSPVSLPYIQSRAKSVVFGASADTDVQLREENVDTKEAIGDFIDSWTAALNIYIQEPTADGRAERIRLAWAHVTEPRSQGCMTYMESLRSWESVFMSSGVSDREIEAARRQTALAKVAPSATTWL